MTTLSPDGLRRWAYFQISLDSPIALPHQLKQLNLLGVHNSELVNLVQEHSPVDKAIVIAEINADGEHICR